MKKTISFILSLLFIVSCFARKEKSPVIIVQVSDPQMGFYHDNRDMKYETEALTKTINSINILNPDAVVFTGDYVHNPQDTNQWNEFMRIISLIKPTIKTFFVPGNHDVTISENSVDTNPYQKYLSDDFFCECVNGVWLTGINTVYIKDELNDPSKETVQYNRLEKSLKKKRNKHTSLVFNHHPYFIEDINEAEGYSTLSPEKRRIYCDLFIKHNVDAVFSGHLHDNAEASYKGLPMITTSAVGRPLGKAQSGVRIILVKDGIVSHKYYLIDDIPTNIKLIK